MRDMKIAIVTAVTLLAFVGVMVLVVYSLKEEPRPAGKPKPFTLSDEESYKNQAPKKMVVIKGATISGDLMLDMDDTYEIEDALEEIRRENEELKRILKEYGSREERRLDEKEFWSTKNR